LATHLDTKGINAVRHINSVFHDVLKLVPWARFDELVGQSGTDDLVCKFTTRHQFKALLFGQLGGGSSLREIGEAMASHGGRLYHCGAQAPKRSTFADANRLRDARVFGDLFKAMLQPAAPGFRRKLGDAVRLIDATGLHLAGVGAEWARFSTQVFGAKAHVVFDPDLGRPVYHALSAANLNDISAAKDMPIEAGATYVFDLGYYDFAWWARLDAQGCRLVTRFKKNTPHVNARALPLDPQAGVVSDRIGFLPERQARNRQNPMRDAVREIVVTTETGKTLRILSNDLDAPAQELADLYKRRWQIELFFRTMKQTLKIASFLGRSENAVRIQVAVALIAFLLPEPVARVDQRKARLPPTGSTRARQSHAQKKRHATQTPPRRTPSTPAKSSSTGATHEPDRRGSSPAMTNFFGFVRVQRSAPLQRLRLAPNPSSITFHASTATASAAKA
jgi:hypothetical protein